MDSDEKEILEANLEKNLQDLRAALKFFQSEELKEAVGLMDKLDQEFSIANEWQEGSGEEKPDNSKYEYDRDIFDRSIISLGHYLQQAQPFLDYLEGKPDGKPIHTTIQEIRKDPKEWLFPAPYNKARSDADTGFGQEHDILNALFVALRDFIEDTFSVSLQTSEFVSDTNQKLNDVFAGLDIQFTQEPDPGFDDSVICKQDENTCIAHGIFTDADFTKLDRAHEMVATGGHPDVAVTLSEYTEMVERNKKLIRFSKIADNLLSEITKHANYLSDTIDETHTCLERLVETKVLGDVSQDRAKE